MKYFIKLANAKTAKAEVKSKFNGYQNRYALRSELGEDNLRTIDWYNKVYAEPELKYYPYFDWREYIPTFIFSIILGFFLGLPFLIWFNNLETFGFISLISILSFIFFLGKNVYFNNKYERKKVKEFNDLKIIENTEELCKKDSNGKRYVVFISYDCDIDNRIVELSDDEYKLLKKYKYEITNHISFPNHISIYEKLYNRATDILLKDLPDEKYTINL